VYYDNTEIVLLIEPALLILETQIRNDQLEINQWNWLIEEQICACSEKGVLQKCDRSLTFF